MSDFRSMEQLLELSRQFQPACVLLAAAELELFNLFGKKNDLTAKEIARQLNLDQRGITILLDALTALAILEKIQNSYSCSCDIIDALTPSGKHCMLSMLQHQANCMRRWADLAKVVKSGRPAERIPSIRGAAGDLASFIGAMNDISGPVAQQIISELGILKCSHVLDIGGGSGTWTLAWLAQFPSARATLLDLPDVIPMAQKRITAAGSVERVTLRAGDFTTDELPAGADLAWLSAIVHQQSRAENVALYAKVHQALTPGGYILIRDMVMDDSHTKPAAGALFAVNMLVGTPCGSTFSMREYREDLNASGFHDVTLRRADESMNAVVMAVK